MEKVVEPYHFGRFALDPAERRLRADGVRVPLGATAFNVLLALVEGAGEVVSKDDLMSRVWGHAVVGDNRLHVHINALRKLVGDDHIVTEQGRGYRFDAKIRRPRSRTQRSNTATSAGNLPAPWTGPTGPGRLIGRASQLRAISDLLARGRLVTLTGPGGVGKTRLALQAARENQAQFPDGVWLVELAALKEPNLTSAAAASLSIKIGESGAPLDMLARQLARKSLLIVLDNCEHMIVAAARLCEAILAAAPGVKILTTSREALSCSGEQVLEVPPLEVPRDGSSLAGDMRAMAAVELFIERARGANTGFQMRDQDVPIVARICRRLDGLPLAIEMVAGWTATLGLKALDTEFDGPATAWVRAGNTAPSRHATLRTTLEWSYELLSAPERTVLLRLAIFAGSFTLEAAKSIVSNDEIPQKQVFGHLGSLIRKSMVASIPGMQRYRLLETTRAFMHENLAASAEGEALRRRHALYVLQMLERASEEWETTGDTDWLERYGPLIDDLRSALDWATEKEPVTAVALAGASWPLWRELWLRMEGRQRLSAAAAQLQSDVPPALEAQLRLGLAELCLNTSAVKAAHAELERAAALYRSLGDLPCLGGTLSRMAFSLLELGRTEEAQQALAEAQRLLEHTGWIRTLITAHSVQVSIETYLGRGDAARAAGEKALRLCELVGAGRSALVITCNLVETFLEVGDIDGAIAAGRDLAVRLRETSNSPLLGSVLGILACALTAGGKLGEALTMAREAAPLLRDHGRLFWLFDHLALRAELGGRTRDAARIAGYADAIYRASGHPREPIGRRAVERLATLLREALPPDEIAQLKGEGARLTEDQAISLALRD